MRRKGFTLVELLVVIGIIALLISVLLPSLNKARSAAVRATCQSNMQQLGQLWHMYANDYKGAFPDAAQGYGTWELITDWQKEDFKTRYKMRNGKVFYCPAFMGFTGGASPDEDWDRNSGSSASGTTWVIGYSIYASSLNAKLWNDSLKNNLAPPYRANERALADRPLLIDITLKYGPPYTPAITWAYSSHFDSRVNKPQGANTLFGDGHVAWKNWGDIRKRLVNYPNQFERWW